MNSVGLQLCRAHTFFEDKTREQRVWFTELDSKKCWEQIINNKTCINLWSQNGTKSFVLEETGFEWHAGSINARLQHTWPCFWGQVKRNSWQLGNGFCHLLSSHGELEYLMYCPSNIPSYMVTIDYIALSCWFVTQGNRENWARISGFLALQRGGSFCSLRRVGEIRDSKEILPKTSPKPITSRNTDFETRLFDLRRITSEIWFCGIMPMPDWTLGIHSVLIKPIDLDCERKMYLHLVLKWAFKCFSIVHLRLAVNSFLCPQDALLEAYGTKEQLTQDREMLDAVRGPKTPVVGSQIEQWAETLCMLGFFGRDDICYTV